jgi:hypothetical protein
MWRPLHGAGAPLRSGTPFAVQEGPGVIRDWTRGLPGSQAFVREARQTAAGSSIGEIECCGVRLLCNYDRNNGDTFILMRRYFAEMLGVCCLDGGRGLG